MLGIIAVQGDMPRLVIDACVKAHRPFFIIALIDQTDPALVENHPHAWVALGQVGPALKALHNAGVTELVMVGSLKRPSFHSLKMDMTALKWFAKVGSAAFGDDGALAGIVKLLEKEGFRIIGPQDILPNILASAGSIGKYDPTDEELEDIQKGIEILKTLSPFDIGQGIILENGVVMSIEAIEGTDGMIERTQSYKREKKAGILVKMCKPQQERRTDLPTIGPRTVEKAAAIGLRGIAVQAGASNIIDLETVKKLADQKGVFIYGFKA